MTKRYVINTFLLIFNDVNIKPEEEYDLYVLLAEGLSGTKKLNLISKTKRIYQVYDYADKPIIWKNGVKIYRHGEIFQLIDGEPRGLTKKAAINFCKTLSKYLTINVHIGYNHYFLQQKPRRPQRPQG